MKRGLVSPPTMECCWIRVLSEIDVGPSGSLRLHTVVTRFIQAWKESGSEFYHNLQFRRLGFVLDDMANRV
eukprot:m.176432 g.176432  ORF g.176432 m.176432 type:complete len:71 (-) comp15444_c0_seq6:1835-2047(-)